MCRARPLASIAALLLAGCAANPALTQAQLNAIETRVVEAGFDETFNAASGALFDAGYIIAMSDRTGGLMTGTQTTQDSGWDQFLGNDPYVKHMVISVQVRPDGSDRSLVRIKTQINGITKVDQAAIDEIWVLMQRQVLMSAPAPERQAAPPAGP